MAVKDHLARHIPTGHLIRTSSGHLARVIDEECPNCSGCLTVPSCRIAASCCTPRKIRVFLTTPTPCSCGCCGGDGQVITNITLPSSVDLFYTGSCQWQGVGGTSTQELRYFNTTGDCADGGTPTCSGSNCVESITRDLHWFLGRGTSNWSLNVIPITGGDLQSPLSVFSGSSSVGVACNSVGSMTNDQQCVVLGFATEGIATFDVCP